MQIIDGKGPEGVRGLVACDECGRWVNATAGLGTDSDFPHMPAAEVCINCLRAALEMMANRPRRPQE